MRIRFDLGGRILTIKAVGMCMNIEFEWGKLVSAHNYGENMSIERKRPFHGHVGNH
jgi:hypothetical protein